MRCRSSAISGRSCTPGMTTPISGATRSSWSRSAFRAASAPGYWSLTATSRPSRQTAAVHLADARRRRGGVVEVAEPGPPSGAELLGHHPVNGRDGIGGAAFCSLVSASRYGAAYSSGIAAS